MLWRGFFLLRLLFGNAQTAQGVIVKREYSFFDFLLLPLQWGENSFLLNLEVASYEFPSATKEQYTGSSLFLTRSTFMNSHYHQGPQIGETVEVTYLSDNPAINGISIGSKLVCIVFWSLIDLMLLAGFTGHLN